MARAIALALVVPMGVPAPGAVAAEGRPDRTNIVVFLADDHGVWDSTVYGATDVRTPNMERLAREGMTFSRAFVASPSCAPSRAAMLTGLMPARNGAEANHSFPRDDIETLPGYLRALGYEVAAFGKVAHGKADRPHRAFDHYDRRYDRDTVAAFLDSREPSRPLCLIVGTDEPHRPWKKNREYDPAALDLPPKFVDTEVTRRFRADYYIDVTLADEQLGEIHDLARREMPGDTLFLYSSDHGAQWPFAKWNLYDDGIRVPLIASWPGKIAPGSTSGAMVSWVDFLPTFVEVAGGMPPEEIDGRSFASVLRGEADSHRDRVFASHSGDGRMNVYPIRALRTDRWKYILNPYPDFQHATHVNRALDGDGIVYWKTWEEAAERDPEAAAIVRRYRRRPREELYDLDADPRELENLADDPRQADRLRGFREELEGWIRSQGDELTVFDEPIGLDDPASPIPMRPSR